MNSVDAIASMQPSPRAPERDSRPAAATGQGEKPAAAQAQRVAEQPQQPGREEMEGLLQRFTRNNTSLSFKVDDQSGRTVILVRDSVTSEVIKQIPSEDMLRVAQRLEAHLESIDDGTGVLLTDEV